MNGNGWYPKVHLRDGDSTDSVCRTQSSFYTPLVVTDDPRKVTCMKCFKFRIQKKPKAVDAETSTQ